MIIDHDMYMRTTPNLLKSPWACVPNWTLTRCLDDLLHLMWLGFGKDLIGQVLFERAMTEYPSLEEGLTGLWRECKLWHKSRKTSFNYKRWTPTTISYKAANDFPIFETKAKAMKTKQVFLWLASSTIVRFNTGLDTSYHAELRSQMLWHLHKFVYTLDGEGDVLSQQTADDVCRDGEDFLRIYTHLASVAQASQMTSYKLRPKLHYFWHLLQYTRISRENPRRRDLFSAEDFIGRVKKIGQKCHRSSASLRIVQRMITLKRVRCARKIRPNSPVTSIGPNLGCCLCSGEGRGRHTYV